MDGKEKTTKKKKKKSGISPKAMKTCLVREEREREDDTATAHALRLEHTHATHRIFYTHTRWWGW